MKNNRFSIYLGEYDTQLKEIKAACEDKNNAAYPLSFSNFLKTSGLIVDSMMSSCPDLLNMIHILRVSVPALVQEIKALNKTLKQQRQEFADFDVEEDDTVEHLDDDLSGTGLEEL